MTSASSSDDLESEFNSRRDHLEIREDEFNGDALGDACRSLDAARGQPIDHRVGRLLSDEPLKVRHLLKVMVSIETRGKKGRKRGRGRGKGKGNGKGRGEKEKGRAGRGGWKSWIGGTPSQEDRRR